MVCVVEEAAVFCYEFSGVNACSSCVPSFRFFACDGEDGFDGSRDMFSFDFEGNLGVVPPSVAV